MNLIAAVLGIAVAVGAGLGLILEGVPHSPAVEIHAATTLAHARKSGCPASCKQPETTESEVTVKSSSPSETGGGSALERAFNNDVGVTILRIVFALLSGFATAFVVQRLALALIDRGEPGPGVQAQPPPEKPIEPTPGKGTTPAQPAATLGASGAEVESAPARAPAMSGAQRFEI